MNINYKNPNNTKKNFKSATTAQHLRRSVYNRRRQRHLFQPRRNNRAPNGPRRRKERHRFGRGTSWQVEHYYALHARYPNPTFMRWHACCYPASFGAGRSTGSVRSFSTGTATTTQLRMVLRAGSA